MERKDGSIASNPAGRIGEAPGIAQQPPEVLDKTSPNEENDVSQGVRDELDEEERRGRSSSRIERLSGILHDSRDGSFSDSPAGVVIRPSVGF